MTTDHAIHHSSEDTPTLSSPPAAPLGLWNKDQGLVCCAQTGTLILAPQRAAHGSLKIPNRAPSPLPPRPRPTDRLRVSLGTGSTGVGKHDFEMAGKVISKGDLKNGPARSLQPSRTAASQRVQPLAHAGMLARARLLLAGDIETNPGPAGEGSGGAGSTTDQPQNPDPIDLCDSPALGGSAQLHNTSVEYFNGYTRTTRPSGAQACVVDAWDEDCTGLEAWLWDVQVDACLEAVQQRQTPGEAVRITAVFTESLVKKILENLGVDGGSAEHSTTETVLQEAVARGLPVLMPMIHGNHYRTLIMDTPNK